MLHVLEKLIIQYTCVTCQRTFPSLDVFNFVKLINYLNYVLFIQFSMV